MTLSVVPGEGSALAFYARLGFVETGEVEGDEHVMRLLLEPGAADRAEDER